MNITRSQMRRFNTMLLLFFAASLLGFFLLNAPALLRNIRYSVLLNSPFSDDELTQGSILELENARLRNNTALASTAGLEAPDVIPAGSYQLIIPKIDVSVPIVLPSDESTKGILASLEEGVGLYPESDTPGTPNGRSVILGHSSRASWYRGDYATVFSLLPKLESLDEFYIVGGGKKYSYRVFSKKILTPQDTNILLAGPSSGSEVDLITCYPIGSASKRTLIQATLVGVEEV